VVRRAADQCINDAPARLTGRVARYSTEAEMTMTTNADARMSDGPLATNNRHEPRLASDIPAAQAIGSPVPEGGDNGRVIDSAHRADFSPRSQTAGGSNSSAREDLGGYVTEWDPRLS